MPGCHVNIFKIRAVSVRNYHPLHLRDSLLVARVESPQDLSRRLVRINIIGLEPLIVLWCTWGLTVSAGLMILPVCGFGLIVLGVLAGSLAASMMKLSGKRRQTFLITSSLANHGFTMGGFLCYFFLGESGTGAFGHSGAVFHPVCVLPGVPLCTGRRRPKDFIQGFFQKNHSRHPEHAAVCHGSGAAPERRRYQKARYRLSPGRTCCWHRFPCTT